MKVINGDIILDSKSPLGIEVFVHWLCGTNKRLKDAELASYINTNHPLYQNEYNKADTDAKKISDAIKISDALVKAKDKRTKEVLGELSFILEDCGAQVEILTTQIQVKVFRPSAIISNAAENFRLINPTTDYEKVAEIGDDTEVELRKKSVLAIKNKEELIPQQYLLLILLYFS